MSSRPAEPAATSPRLHDRTDSTWTFWVVLLAAVYPLATGVGMVHLVVTTHTDWFQPTGPGAAPATTADRWAQVLSSTTPGWTPLLSALVSLALAAVVTSSRSTWMRGGTAGAWALFVTGASAALCAAGGLGLRWWNGVRAPTALEALGDTDHVSAGYARGWVLDTSMGVTAVLLGLLVTVLAVRHATLSGGPREPGGRTVGG